MGKIEIRRKDGNRTKLNKNGLIEIKMETFQKNKVIELLSKLKLSSDTQLSEEKKICLTKIPSSYAQADLWYVETNFDTKSTFNLFFCFDIEGPLNIEILEDAFLHIINRHFVLRSVFLKNGDAVVQEILLSPKTTVEKINLSITDENDESINERMIKLANEPFDLSKGPLLKVKLICRNDHEHILLIIVHHIIFDGWSSDILFKELSDFYNCSLKKVKLSIEDLESSYRDYIQVREGWLQSQEATQQLEYWKKKLTGAEDINLNFMKYTPKKRTFNGQTVRIDFSKDLYSKVMKIYSEQKVTVFSILFTTLNIVLAKHSQSMDVSLGVPVANRNSIEAEKIIGLFSNTLAIRTRIDRDEEIISCLRRIHDNCIEAFENQEYPFEKLIQEMGCATREDRAPLFQIMFLFQTFSKTSFKLVDLHCKPRDLIRYDSTEFELTFWFEHLLEDDKISLTCLYNTDLFLESSVKQFINDYLIMTKIMLCDSAKTVGKILDSDFPD